MKIDNIDIDSVVAGCLEGERRRIVIPSFGAFIRRPEGGLVFIDILNADDGKLSAELQRRLGLTGDEARRATEKYAYRLKNELLYNKRVEIGGIGTLRMTADGSFEIDPHAADSSGSDGDDAVAAAGNAVPQAGTAAEAGAPEEPADEPDSRPAGAITEPEIEVIIEEKAEAESAERVQISEPAEETTTESEEKEAAHEAVKPLSAPDIAERNPETGAAGALPEPLVPENPHGTDGFVPAEKGVAEATEKGGFGESAPDAGGPEPEYGIRSQRDREMLRTLLYGDDDAAEIEAKYEAFSAVAEPAETQTADETVSAADATVNETADAKAHVAAAKEGSPEQGATAHGQSEPEHSEQGVAVHAKSEPEHSEQGVAAHRQGEPGQPESAAKEDIRQFQLRRPKRKRVDAVLVIAVIAILVAAAVLIYGETAVGNINLDLKELIHGSQSDTSAASPL